MLGVRIETVRLFLHILAATIWVGGQLTLAGLVPVLRAAGVDVPRRAATRFAWIAWPAFGVLILTGLWNVAAEAKLMHGRYLTTFTIKMGVVVLSGVSAFLHARATSRRGMAIWGALTGLAALLALFLGVLLSTQSG